jgi:hypothetical protein
MYICTLRCFPGDASEVEAGQERSLIVWLISIPLRLAGVGVRSALAQIQDALVGLIEPCQKTVYPCPQP